MIFFFSVEAGKSGPKTTQNELIGLIKQHANFKSVATMNADLKTADVAKSAAVTMDAGVIEMCRE